MNIRERLVGTANRLYGTFSPVSHSGIYRVPGEPTYNPATGTVEPNNEDTPVTVIWEMFREDQINGDTIKVGDRIGKVRDSELGKEPSSDAVLIVDSVTWAVQGWSTDPGNVIWNLHMRTIR